MRVLLVDEATTGHRVEYAAHIARWCVEQGDDVRYATLAPDDRLDLLRDAGASVTTRRASQPSADGHGRRQAWLLDLYGWWFAEADDWGVDVVHQLFLDGTELALLARTTFRSTDWRTYGTLFNPRYDRRTGSLAARAFRRATRRCLRRLLAAGTLDSVFVHSDRLAGRVASEADALDGAVRVVPDPVEPVADLSKEAARRRLDLPTERTLLLFFGGLRRDKGPGVLLDALDRLDLDATVVMAGPGDDVTAGEVAERNRRLDPSSLDARIGFVPDDDVDAYFRAADAVLLPYRSTYVGTSGILQRAIAAGRPVVATDVGDVGPTVDEWGVGVVVEPDSPAELARGVRAYLADADGYDRVAAAVAPKYVREHHWRRLGAGVRHAYTEAGRSG